MKTRWLGLIVLMLFVLSSAMAQNKKTEQMEVAGNCGMCKTRIENAAKSLEGVSSAEWNKETKMLELAYDPARTDIHKIHMAIAKAGHDTRLHKARDEDYNQLPSCCKYERFNEEAEASHEMEGHKD